ncbi:MAG: undecaprenyl-diphosphate phosphatase [Synergistetes bacterium]|nr:undecaprenyl-diphosphate phosphatase [Synergistota bacterium]
MTALEGFILGAVQGLTEFLPISSSGHLVILEKLWGIGEDILFFNVSLHAASLLALFIVFRRTVLSLLKGFFFEGGYYGRLSWVIVFALIPTGIIGITLEKRIELLGMREIGVMYLITAFFLFSMRYLGGLRDLRSVGLRDGVFIGIAQGIGVLPGISRSGITIFAGSYLGLDRDSAIRFSFLLAIPTIGGAFLLELKDAFLTSGRFVFFSKPLLIGFLSSFIFSLLAIEILLRTLVQRKIHWFSLYCLFLGVILLLIR